MKDKLENFDIFMCDKCGKIILVNDVNTLNLATSHHMNCICNKQIIKNYNSELDKCISDEDFEIVHRKYLDLL